MIVCLCRGVSDKEVRSIVNRGASTLSDIADACGAGTGCGSCCDMLCKMMGESTRESAEHSDRAAAGNNSQAQP